MIFRWPSQPPSLAKRSAAQMQQIREKTVPVQMEAKGTTNARNDNEILTTSFHYPSVDLELYVSEQDGGKNSKLVRTPAAAEPPHPPSHLRDHHHRHAAVLDRVLSPSSTAGSLFRSCWFLVSQF